MSYNRRTAIFTCLSDAVQYCREQREIEQRGTQELSNWMELHQNHLDNGDSFDCIDGPMHTVPAS